MELRPWWRDSVIYQVYVRSFADSNGDGLGDLPGLISRLDHLADLGVGALWLSPISPSPDADFGYDVADYTGIDPRYGTAADFGRLVDGAHRRGIRIVMDMVMNHTSDRHPWFVESRSSRTNPRRDWYLWRDRPNNWKSVFGGRAWTLEPATGQYYLHLFAAAQPDLNWRNPAVRAAALDIFRAWLDRGVDGFRLDVFNAYFKHPSLPDNPVKPGIRAFDRLRHLNDIDQPEMKPFLRELRALLDSRPGRYAVGETFLSTPEKAASYCGDASLHAAFSFDFTGDALRFPWNARWLRERISRREAVFGPAGPWPTTVMSNHDLPRAASRYCRGNDDAQARLAMALLLTLRGTPFLYYGEEIGMRDIRLRRRDILDPAGKIYWPVYKGRDGCRSPMQWDGSKGAGFSAAEPWLPLHPGHFSRNVTAQAADPGSLFNFTKALIALRKTTPALTGGDMALLPSPRGTLAYTRGAPGQRVIVAMNFSKRRVVVPMPEISAGLLRVLLQSGTGAGLPGAAAAGLVLEPREVVVAALRGTTTPAA